MRGQVTAHAQVALDHVEALVLAHADHVQVHQRADRALREGEDRLHLGPILARQRAEEVRDHVLRQVRHQVRDLVAVQVLRDLQDLAPVHVGDEGLAHRVGDLEQHRAVQLGRDQRPDLQAVLHRQALQHVGDVRRVQAGEPVLQLGPVLARDQRLHQFVLGHRLATHQILHEPLLVEQLQDVLEGGLQALLVVGLEFHGRCRSVSVRVGVGEARADYPRKPPRGESPACPSSACCSSHMRA